MVSCACVTTSGVDDVFEQSSIVAGVCEGEVLADEGMFYRVERYDSRKDWATESARMGAIYRGAYLTISATSVANDANGCLRQRQSSTEARSYTGQQHFQAELYAGMEHQHVVPLLLCGMNGAEIILTWLGNFKVFTRKWCFQDRMLSRRIVHYIEDKLAWECSSRTGCECGRVTRDRTNPSKNNLNYGFFGSVFDDLAEETKVADQRAIQQRSSSGSCGISSSGLRCLGGGAFAKILTKEANVLPAFSAIARAFAHTGLGDYSAGLWSSEMLSLLCWSLATAEVFHMAAARVNILDEARSKLRRNVTDCVPSWTWASVQGAVRFDPDAVPFGRFEEDNEQILSASCSPIENDEVGRVSHASLQISARRHVERVAGRDKKGSSLRFEVIRSDMPMLHGALKPLDCYLGTEDEYDSLVGQGIWFAHVRGGCWMMLRGVHDGNFRRIGLCMTNYIDPNLKRQCAGRVASKMFTVV